MRSDNKIEDFGCDAEDLVPEGYSAIVSADHYGITPRVDYYGIMPRLDYYGITPRRDFCVGINPDGTTFLY